MTLMKCEQHDSTDNGVVEHKKKDKKRQERDKQQELFFSFADSVPVFFLFFRFNSNRHLRLFFSLSSLCACLPLRLNGLWLAQGTRDCLQTVTVSDNRHPAVARPCPRVHAHCRIVTMVCFATTHTFFLCAPATNHFQQPNNVTTVPKTRDSLFTGGLLWRQRH